jgi:uncharacterized protein (DUF305 family)
MMFKSAGVTLSLVALSATIAIAADPHAHHDHGSAPSAKTEAATAFAAANEKMHKEMDVDLTGDADVDFVRGMIPHHEGAVEMAKIQLKYGKDPKLRKLAEDIIKAQDTEIAFMKSWLDKRKP